MNGFVPVDIPTKKYIKAYVHFKLGKNAVMKVAADVDPIVHKFYDLLNRQNNEEDLASLPYIIKRK